MCFACTFSTSQLPKVVRTPGVLYILTSKCASRRNGVHFFDHLIWPKAGSAPAAVSEPTFSTLRSPKSLEKHSVSRLSYLFAHLHLLSSYSSSSTLLSSTLSLLSASSLLLLFICPYCRKFAPSNGVHFDNFRSLIWPAGSAPAALASLLLHHSRSPKYIGHYTTQCFATFLPFRAISIYFLLTTSSSTTSFFYSFYFSLPTSLLCFSSVHIVGSLTSTLHFFTTTLHYTPTTLHYTTLHYTTLHYTTLTLHHR